MSVTLPSGGTVRPITRWGEPVMHHKLQPVTEYDEALETLVADMFATMYAAEGAGLAANQIGVDLQVFVFDCTDGAGKRVVGVVCNPVLTLPETGDRNLDDSEEGCLSLPGAYTYCARPDWSQVDGTDHTGAPVTYVGEGGTLARCLQHETDHLMGTVFGDRVPSRARKKLYKQAEAIAEDYPAAWPAVARVSSAHDL
ncbi:MULTISPECIES: peptide deformylase [Mumia]|uniref:peptide deformylase n=1 Tax=Mumia TaxID=1546255 RepID=UPI00142226C3|nr:MULTISPECIES: peptide deformylase [unclassified Mumia]QMW64720.1 peptide deformylase [Mumia sp. ZJ1417]